jgi:hypothetical protein
VCGYVSGAFVRMVERGGRERLGIYASFGKHKFWARRFWDTWLIYYIGVGMRDE